MNFCCHATGSKRITCSAKRAEGISSQMRENVVVSVAK